MAPGTSSGGRRARGTSRCQRASTTTTPRNDAAFRRKTQPAPRAATRSPPSAGPRARATLTEMPPSATAPASSSRGTRSGVVACQAGALSALPRPMQKVSESSSHGPVRPSTVQTPSAAAATSIHTCVARSSRRRSTMSASAPAGSARRKNGRLVAVCMSDTMRGEGASPVMSHAAFVSCIHVPTFETHEASQSARKTGWASGLQADAGRIRACYAAPGWPVKYTAREGALGAVSRDGFVTRLATPRIVWLMVPAAIVDATLDDLSPRLAAGDVVVDGGNSYYRDDIERAKRLATRGLHYVDCGTSGGVWGLERGYCLMIGGDADVVGRLDPLFATLAPGAGSVAPSPGRAERAGTVEQGYLHCGPNGAGHFVKMVHNGIEYGLMAAYAEGLNILRHADVGLRARAADAETTPLRNPEYYQYDLNLAEIAEVWRRGSVVASWLLDLTPAALASDPTLARFAGRVSDSGEGRWTLDAAIDEAVPAHVLAAALFERFASRGEADFQDRLLSAMRFEFGGHLEKGSGT